MQLTLKLKEFGSEVIILFFLYFSLIDVMWNMSSKSVLMLSKIWRQQTRSLCSIYGSNIYRTSSVGLVNNVNTHAYYRRPERTLLGITQNISQKHTFYTSSQQDQQRKFVIKFPNPFKWMGLKVKLVLMRSFFDTEFNVDNFISGARQVSRKFLCTYCNLIPIDILTK